MSLQMIFIGPPGAGKGTQAAQLSSHLSIPHISTGDMLRNAVKAGTKLGIKADEYMKQGALVPDELVIDMVQERILQADCANGFILDGFPRTLKQAGALEQSLTHVGTAINAVLLIEVPDSLILERITGRRSDPQTGAIYHIKFNPPPPEIADRVVQRKDDTSEACKARLQKYHSETAPLIPFYEQKGILMRIDGIGSPEDVRIRIMSALQTLE